MRSHDVWTSDQTTAHKKAGDLRDELKALQNAYVLQLDLESKQKQAGPKVQVQVNINGKNINGYNKTGKTEVPMRELTKALGGQIFYNDSDHTATVTFDNGNNGQKTFTYDTSGTGTVMVNLTDFVDYFKGKGTYKYDYKLNDGKAVVNVDLNVFKLATTNPLAPPSSNSSCSICVPDTPDPVRTNGSDEAEAALDAKMAGKPDSSKGKGNDGDKSPIGSTSEFKQKYGDTINQMAKELKVDPNMLAAVILVESGGSGFVDGNLKIRFENHYFLNRTEGNTDLFTYYWKDHKFRTSTDEEWKAVHTGKQSSEYAAFNFAKSLNEEAAYQSISMGLGQIMGGNFAAAGYSSAKEMYEDFSKGHEQQIKGMATFFKNYNNGSTLRALQKGDLATFVTQYNGDGQVSTYTKLMNKRMEEYKNAE